MKKKYIKRLIERDTPKKPYLDTDTLRAVKPAVRCPMCDYILVLQMVQFCPCCGQRFVEKKNK